MTRYGWILAAFAAGLIAPGCAKAKPSDPAVLPTKPTLTLTVFGRSSKIILIRPQRVVLQGLLSEAADLSEYECAGIEWTVPGEGGGLNQPLMNCHSVTRFFRKEVYIGHYGVHTARLRILSGYTGKVLSEASVEIEIHRPDSD